MPNGLQSNPKLFADDTSLFSTVQDITTSTVSLNNDLTKILENGKWKVEWKMNFNPDPSKQHYKSIDWFLYDGNTGTNMKKYMK